MAFTPTVLRPDPDPGFVRQLHIIDPTLRLVWGYDRYLLHCWVIERHIPPARYAAIYASSFAKGEARYMQQPIIDHDKPIYNSLGEEMGFEIVGYRQYDLRPEWEWIANIQTPDGEFKQPGEDDLISLRRQYAWNWRHMLSRAKFEEEERLKKEAREKADKQKRMDIYLESYDQALHETDFVVVSGQPETIMPGTEI